MQIGPHLVINTGTSIVTFLMVFLIQNNQNRASLATQIKLDELIRRGVNDGLDRLLRLARIMAGWRRSIR